MNNDDVLTTETIEKVMAEARKHRIEPIRYASTDVSYIKSGPFKGMLVVRKGAKPRKNGKVSTYPMILNPKSSTKISSWKKKLKIHKDLTYNVILPTGTLKVKDE